MEIAEVNTDIARSDLKFIIYYPCYLNILFANMGLQVGLQEVYLLQQSNTVKLEMERFNLVIQLYFIVVLFPIDPLF